MTETSAPGPIMRFLRGRSRRLEYWVCLAVLLASQFVLIQMLGPAIASLASLPFWVVIGGRRLHDFNRSAWWTLVPFTVGFVLGFLAGVGFPIDPTVRLAINAAVAFGVMLVVGLWPGTTGQNRFGPPPMTRAHGQLLG